MVLAKVVGAFFRVHRQSDFPFKVGCAVSPIKCDFSYKVKNFAPV